MSRFQVIQDNGRVECPDLFILNREKYNRFCDFQSNFTSTKEFVTSIEVFFFDSKTALNNIRFKLSLPIVKGR